MITMIFRLGTIGMLFLAILGTMTLLGSPIWWLALPLAVCVYMICTLVLKKLFATAFMIPFKMKGAVLHGARLTIHAIEPSERPTCSYDDGEEAYEDDAALRVYYRLDITIAPTATSTSMTYWEPGELILIPDTVKPNAEIWAELEEAGYVETVEVFDGEQFVPDEDYKYEGTQRLRLLMSVQADCRRARLQYYFEDIGGLDLPIPTAPSVTL